ncbi:response regulator transcription factor [Pedobacter frigiditerrae]|uniref:Response regulator transcription factor n=1 Tax=Pedobacter frigiditerrae TaxID=2530452 RepID=A0A4R0MK25_9SPHI|nr:response regulator transcription factor [Pedobacter frigiditerrae]TCC86677.1 response regulator transcription factor [Pedobacter frigiditerrae]
MKIQMILADDHPVVLKGINAHLSQDQRFQVIAMVNNGLELLNSMALDKADIILLDLNMPGLDGLKAITALIEKRIKAKIIVLTNYHSFELVKDCKLRGASAYIVKSDELQNLANTILNVMAGKEVFPRFDEKEIPDATFSYFDDFLKKYRLTKREVEIIRLVCQNLRTKDIAERLYLSEFTVHTHRKNIMRKLELSDSTVALYEFAIKANLIS